MSVNYGQDTACLTDIGLIDQQITDPFILVGQRICRRLTTPRGGLGVINDDPNYGWNINQYALGKLSPAAIAQAQQQIQNEVLKDEEVSSATVVMTFSGGALVIGISLVASPGPFVLTLTVNQLTTTAVFSF